MIHPLFLRGKIRIFPTKYYNRIINMDRDKIFQKISEAADAGKASGNCLTPEEMAQLIDGFTTDEERDIHLKHIALCRNCREAWELAASITPPQRKNHFRIVGIAASIIFIASSLYLLKDSPSEPAEALPLHIEEKIQTPPAPTAPLKSSVLKKRKKENSKKRPEVKTEKRSYAKQTEEKELQAPQTNTHTPETSAAVSKDLTVPAQADSNERYLTKFKSRKSRVVQEKHIQTPRVSHSLTGTTSPDIATFITQPKRSVIEGVAIEGTSSVQGRFGMKRESPENTPFLKAFRKIEKIDRNQLRLHSSRYPEMLIVTNRSDYFVIPSTLYFVVKTERNSSEHIFLKQAARGWVIPDQNFIIRTDNRNTLDIKKLLTQWQTLLPKLTGTYREIAESTINYLQKFI